MNVPQLMWAVGLFEGEGCITKASNRPGSFTMELWMSDKDIVERFHAAVGVGSLKERAKKRDPNHATMYGWTLYSRDLIRGLLNDMLPHFGHRRAHKALDVLDVLECT